MNFEAIMPFTKSKIPPVEEEDEIVSFETFCGERSGSGGCGGGGGALTLNDNINYRLYYEPAGLAGSGEGGGGGGASCEEKETSLGGVRAAPASGKRKPSSVFGRGAKSTLLGSAAGQPRSGGDGDGQSPGYRRFSERRGGDETAWGVCPPMVERSGLLVLCVLALVCGGAWWAVSGLLGEAWGDAHYRRLWVRAHPDRAHHLSPVVLHHDPDAVPPSATLPVPNFHDHNNLSTKNRVNATENSKKKERSRGGSGGEGRGEDNLCSSVVEERRFDCFPAPGATEQACLERGCCWVPKEAGEGGEAAGERDSVGVPYCFYPPHYGTYRFANMTETRRGVTVHYERARPSGYPGDFRVARMEVRYLSDDTLQIKILDAEHHRWEPPYPELPAVGGAASRPLYRVAVDSRRTGFKVLRRADNVTLLDAEDIGGLILSDRMLQLSTVLPTHSLYGLGERRGPLALSTNWTRHTLYNYDTVPVENSNLYGSHPFYLALEESGRSHGVLLFNSNAMDVALQPAPAVTWRAVGGVLDLRVLLGPSPAAVVAQYTALVGRPHLPPYWALGFHLCKFNYGSLNATKEVWQRTRDAGIPFDVQWNDLDYMNNSNDFTYDRERYAGLPQFVRALHAAGMHYVPLIDPGVSAAEVRGGYPPYDAGLAMDVFVKNSSLQPFVGKVWNKHSTVWPDFTHPNATSYWRDMLRGLHEQLPFDGAWIDMNEPSNFVSGPLGGACGAWDTPYAPHVAGGEGLRSHSICPDAVHHVGAHYDVHNLYGLTEARATHAALLEIRGNRSFIISRSSFVGLGRYAGHWSGDVRSEWSDMEASIPELLSFSLFGVPLMGADICGFSGDATPELCKRWMQLGAFYPFSRNHNSDKSTPQDPVALGAEVAAASRDALRMRYTILPYLYTLFWRAHVDGATVARPLFFEFPLDKVTWSIELQFMLGPSVMVAPVLSPGARSLRAYLPRQLWYRLNGTRAVPFTGWGRLQEDETVLVKGGSVLALQPPAERGPVTTSGTRSRPLQLLVAPCDMQRAHGELFWDEGDAINTLEEKKYSHVEFHLEERTLRGAPTWWGWGVPPVQRVLVMGQAPVSTVTLGGRAVPHAYRAADRLLVVYNLTLALDASFELAWH